LLVHETHLRLTINDIIYIILDSNVKTLLSSFVIPHHKVKLEVVSHIEEENKEIENINGNKLWELYKGQMPIGINITQVPTNVYIEVIAKPRRRATPDLSRYPALTLRIDEIDTLSTFVFRSKYSLLGILIWSWSSSPSSASFLQFVDS
jgi:hypothetical protein